MSATDQSFELKLEKTDNTCTDFLQCNVCDRVSSNTAPGDDRTLKPNESYRQQTHGNNNLLNGSNQYRSKENDERNDEVCFNIGNDSSVFIMSGSPRSPDTVVADVDCTTCRNAAKGDSPAVRCSEPNEDTKATVDIPEKTVPLEDMTFNELDFPLPIFESTTCATPAGRRKIEEVRNTETTKKSFSRLIKDSSQTIMESSGMSNYTSIQLKPGKKWRRSASVMKKVLNGTLHDSQVSRKRGKNYLPFVEEVLSMQNEDSEETSPEENSVISIISGMSNLALTLRSVGNRTVRVVDQTAYDEMECSFRSVFIRGVNADKSATVITDVNRDEVKIFSARDLVLMRCGQEEPLPFEEYFNERTLKNCRKIGEGAFGEVFMCNSKRVFKVIPIEGEDDVNGEPQKKFEEVFTEMVVAMELSNLRTEKENNTSGFCESKRCWCVVGKYPQHLIDLWNDFDSARGSENDSPVMFKSDQLYIVMEFANGGQDLEAFVFASAEQSLSIFYQLVYTLAVAEKVLEFEHRDLHWGNILIAPTREKYFKVLLNGEECKVPTSGVKLSVIDFTLSRISYDGCCIYNDLSVDPTLFTSHGDYQFDIYRMMKEEVSNDWSLFRPKTNLFWLHYVADKMITMTRYKKTNTKIHKTSIQRLTELKSRILNYSNSEQLADEELI
ncbi:UNVERIFIED_CONTAM: hypothetical protein PYX00_007738 [Menopon gallinae]|uniref:non-specific serine/threonine protein kinase n=1 Tax=Menopon gallinae TaxID=328185 RepID=A0AAW2HKJ6_9NEOP